VRARDIADRVFAVGSHIRYVAVREGPDVHLATREELDGASSPESDRYEELLVNPTLLTLTTQRGDIDCGGLEYILVGYGNFRQLVIPTDSGHVSIAMEKAAVTIDGLDDIRKAVAEAR
jgi:hypothetical protein